VIISFRTSKLRKVCNNITEATQKWGPEMAKLIFRRLQEITASPNLAEFRKLPSPRCHPLIGDKKGLYSADLKHPYRLLFSIDHDPVPRTADRGVDEIAVTKICIHSVEDTH